MVLPCFRLPIARRESNRESHAVMKESKGNNSDLSGIVSQRR